MPTIILGRRQSLGPKATRARGRGGADGPVAPVVRVADFDEGLRRASASAYGLAATVLTPSLDHALRAADVLDVGTVKVNAVFGGAPGGSADPRRGSGGGAGYGPDLLDELTVRKSVHLEGLGTP